MKKKILIMTIGTGTGAERVKGLANGIIYSIKTHHPDKILFLTSREGQESTLKLVIGQIKSDYKYEVELTEDINDIERIYETSMNMLEKIIQRGIRLDDIVVDYTSGTKAMSAGLAIAAVAKEVEMLSYITGKRANGIVISGTERIISLKPSQISLDKKIKLIKFLFNKNQFDSCLEIIGAIKTTTSDPAVQGIVSRYEYLCMGYSYWDKFNHDAASEILLKLKDFEGISLSSNKTFLGSLKNAKEKAPFLIACLLNNAERRALEGRYDDAVARLYRIMELIAQYRLQSKHGIDPSDVDRSRIPAELQAKYAELENSKKIQIALYNGYELLHALGDELGQKFFQNKDLLNQLQSRNYSILAHGLESVTKKMHERLLAHAREFISHVIKDAEKLARSAKFTKFGI